MHVRWLVIIFVTVDNRFTIATVCRACIFFVVEASVAKLTSLGVFVCLFVCLYFCLCFCSFASLSLCLFVCLFLCSFLYLFVSLFVSLYLGFLFFVCLSIHFSLCVFFSLPLCLFVSLFLCLFSVSSTRQLCHTYNERVRSCTRPGITSPASTWTPSTRAPKHRFHGYHRGQGQTTPAAASLGNGGGDYRNDGAWGIHEQPLAVGQRGRGWSCREAGRGRAMVRGSGQVKNTQVDRLFLILILQVLVFLDRLSYG